jgi:hypothetical protein
MTHPLIPRFELASGSERYDMRFALAKCWSERCAPCALRSMSVDALEGAGEGWEGGSQG